MKRNLKEASRLEWVTGAESASIEEIKLGAILRIADATEIMAQNFVKLQNERDMWKRECDRRGRENEAMGRQNASLKGVITKLRKAAKTKSGE